MKKKITPCICCDHEPTAADSVYYGMPCLQPTADMNHWSIYCPVCGRGGIQQFSSPYYAVKDWNEMQKHLQESKEWDSLFE